MNWTRQKDFIAYSILILALIQAVGAGAVSYIGYDMTFIQEVCYPYIFIMMVAFYLKSIGCSTRGSLNFGLIYYYLNPYFAFYMLIKKYSWLKGVVFILIWFMLLLSGILSWTIIDILFWY